MALVTHRNQSVNLHKFAMVPRADVPRSRFNRVHKHKTTFDAGYLIPIFVDEMVPGDTFSIHMTGFIRTASPMLYPLMDNLYATTFFFFMPNRLGWTNFVKMMGEQDNPGDSTSYTLPTCTSKAGGYDVNSLHDYFGLPTAGSPFGGASTFTHQNLPLRAYNQIYNAWFRSENLTNSLTKDVGDGPDTYTNYTLQRRLKRYDYINQALPWPQKGATAVSMPLGTSAPVKAFDQTTSLQILTPGDATTQHAWQARVLDSHMGYSGTAVTATRNATLDNAFAGIAGGLYADLSTATAASINALRLAFMTQALLEKKARGGTRYGEQVWQLFGVMNPDARLQRPEYIGGSTSPIIVNPTVQTSGTSASGTTTPLGQLSGVTTGVLGKGHGFTYSATEHGHVIGLICIDADLTYQQGVRRMWTRSTEYDFYTPGFAGLGEQTLRNDELYAQGSAGGSADAAAFGYVPRWDEYRFFPSLTTGLFRSTATGTLDAYHLAQKFTSLPTLNTSFMESNPPLDRVLAVSSQTGKQFIFDSYWQHSVSRPIPMYGVPATIGRF